MVADIPQNGILGKTRPYVRYSCQCKHSPCLGEYCESQTVHMDTRTECLHCTLDRLWLFAMSSTFSDGGFNVVLCELRLLLVGVLSITLIYLFVKQKKIPKKGNWNIKLHLHNVMLSSLLMVD